MEFFNKKIVIFLAGVAVVISLHYSGALNIIERYALVFLKSAERVVFLGGNSFRKEYSGDYNLEELRKINEELEKKNRELLNENINLKILQDENKALRDQLTFYSRYDYPKIIANIISRHGEAGSDQIITIDKGENDGIKPGQAVISGNGMIAGKIFSVEKNLSYAYLITDKNCRLTATPINNPETSGITSGELGLTVKMNYIPQIEQISAGDVIITSGLEQKIPKGLIIGTVEEVQRESNDLFQSAVISPSINLNTISIISVILK